MSTETTLRDAILALLDERVAGATICPSEAAHRVDPEGRRGEPVDPATARGPVRLRSR